MRASFFGHVSPVGSQTKGAQQDDARTEQFDDGFVACGREANLVREDELICIALGAARFDKVGGGRVSDGLAAHWLSAYRRHGVDAVSFATGRFAVVIVNTAERSVWAATDRFATYPICFASDSRGFQFSDRANALVSSVPTLTPQAIFSYLFFHAIPAPQTVFDGVFRVEPGHYVTWKQGGQIDCVPWWRPVFEEPSQADFESSKREFLSLVRQGVEREVATGEVGAFLSGGTDSSTVSGVLTDVLGQPARTYSIGFDSDGYDEMAYARLAAKHFGTDHHEYYVTPDDLLESIPKVAAHYDQPFGNSSAVPAYICAQRARDDGVTKLLAGDGGDELFGGNVRYAKQRVFGLYDRVPSIVRSAALEPVLGLTALHRMPLFRKGASYVEQARVPMPDRMQMYNMLLRLGVDKVFERDFLAHVDQQEPFVSQRKIWDGANAGSMINRMLTYDLKYTLTDSDLPKVIGTTRLAGVEVGFPLLTDELMDFSAKLPPEWKLKRFQLRWFFKEALRGLLPDEIIAKKKHGFGLPFGVWACEHDGLKTLARDALKSIGRRGIVRPDFIDTLVNEHLPAYPRYYGEMVWILMVMEFWIREHAPDWRANA